MNHSLLHRLPFLFLLPLLCIVFAHPIQSGTGDWREQNFATRANTGSATDLSDPDGDGIANLVEYSLLRDPNRPDRHWGTVAVEGSNLTIVYARRKTALTEMVFEPLAANDIRGPWFTTGFTQTVLGESGDTQSIKASIPLSMARFVKLQVRRTLTEPATPGSLAAAMTASAVNLSWTDLSNNESGFRLERRISGTNNFVLLQVLPPNANSYQDSTVNEGITYIYRLCATNAAGDSPLTPDARITASPSIPAAPSNALAISTSPTQATLSWTDNSSNETGFKIERRASGGTFAPLTSVGANQTSLQDSNLNSGITYIYRVCATNTAGDSAWSADARVNMPQSIPSAPTNFAGAPISGTRIDLSWTDSSNNESGFKIERRVSGGSFAPLLTLNSNTTSYSDPSVNAGGTYIYRICSTNTAGDSAWSAEARITTPGAASSIGLSMPLSRIVFQRNNANEAFIPIRGTYSGSPSRIEARALTRVSGQGTSTDWTTIVNNPAGGNFAGRLLAQGGWYQLEVRAVTGSTIGESAVVDRVGVGEVFVVAGHSVAQGQDINIEAATDDRVSAVYFDGRNESGSLYPATGDMAHLPMTFSHFSAGMRPAPSGAGTYFWSKMCQHLVDRLNVPVLLFNAGYGGTSMEHWAKAALGQPFEHWFVDSSIRMPYINLSNSLRKYGAVTGVRGVLADQGQNDNGRIRSVGENQVYSEYQTWVNQARNDLGYGALAIMVNRQTPYVDTPNAFPEVRRVQQRMVDSHPHCFAGPDYDWMSTNTDYRPDGIHLGAAGEVVAAQWWADAITNTSFLNQSQPYQPGY